eukprot:TRINITY_DN10099_c0_g3_i1.p1 TRINITY_DN10099_c0_g3~~TRINITY_DN10099_c0_g3_i1.p1  ORF type:complete len:540 (+),score=119.35 TRINITY_DN10099_c0_g3_i1:66-1622(+)
MSTSAMRLPLVQRAVFGARRQQASIAKSLFKGTLESRVYPYPDGSKQGAVKGCRDMEEMGRQDLGLALKSVTHDMSASKITETHNEILKDIEEKGKAAAYCLTEESCGTDPSGIQTTATLSNDETHYILNGKKTWVANGAAAEYLLVLAMTQVNETSKRLTCFLVDRKVGGVTNGPPYPTSGLKSCPVHDVEFKNVKVPKENVIDGVGGGHKLALALRTGTQHRLSAAVLGGHKRLLSYMTEHCNNRKAFGRRLRDLSLIKQRLAMSTMRVYATESMLYLLAHDIDAGLDVTCEAAMVKIFSVRSALDSLDDGLQVLGGRGYLTTDTAEQLFRDINGFRSVGGTEEINSLFLALTGLEVAGAHLRTKGTLSIMAGRTKRSLGLVSIHAGHHPSLKQAAGIVDKMLVKTNAALEAVLIKFGKKITDEQIVVSKVAEVTTLLYSMVAVLSRASKSASTSCDSSQHEIVLATTWVRHCTVSLNTLLNDIENIFKTLDSNLGRIADHVSDVGGYIPTHPADF